MSYVDGDTFVIEAEPHRKCSQCGKVAECRPYGPDGSDICYDCGMKDPRGTLARFMEAIKTTTKQVHRRVN